LKAEDELISKLKTEIGKTLPVMFRGMAEEMLEKNKDVIINWLKENKDLVKEVIES
jgi:ribosomal protein S17E